VYAFADVGAELVSAHRVAVQSVGQRGYLAGDQLTRHHTRFDLERTNSRTCLAAGTWPCIRPAYDSASWARHASQRVLSARQFVAPVQTC